MKEGEANSTSPLQRDAGVQDHRAESRVGSQGAVMRRICA